MSEPDNKTYLLETMADFWALGDADRIKRAFKEIGLGMAKMRDLEVLIGTPVAFPRVIEWVDDGGEFVGIQVVCEDATLCELNMTLGADFHSNTEKQS